MSRRTTLSRIIGASCPAHMPYQVEILVGGAAVQETEEAAAPPPADDHVPGAVDLPGSERIELARQAPVSEEELEGPAEGLSEGTEPSP